MCSVLYTLFVWRVLDISFCIRFTAAEGITSALKLECIELSNCLTCKAFNLMKHKKVYFTDIAISQSTSWYFWSKGYLCTCMHIWYMTQVTYVCPRMLCIGYPRLPSDLSANSVSGVTWKRTNLHHTSVYIYSYVQCLFKQAHHSMSKLTKVFGFEPR